MVVAPFLIFGWGPFPEMGVSGAAVATFISIVVGVVWISFYFIDAKAYLRFHFGHWKPQFRVWWDMLKIGLPAGAEFALMGLYMGVVYAITKPFGAPAQGGFTIGLRVVQSAFLPIVALGFSVAPVAGQNFAARKGDRVREAFKTAASMAAVFMLLIGVAMYFGAAAVMRIFTKDAEADRGGRRVSADRRGHVRAVRHHVRVVEHVPGAWQYDPAAGDIDVAHPDRGDPGSLPRARRRVPPGVDLVSGRDRDDAADDAQPDPAAARIQIEARVDPGGWPSALGDRLVGRLTAGFMVSMASVKIECAPCESSS